MERTSINWNRLFLFCLGLFIAATFSMKWIEPDLIYNNSKISIFGLELFYPKARIIEIFTGIDDNVRTILGYHLSFDFIFMAGCFPGIASLCMMASDKLKKNRIKAFLFGLAFLQLIAWSFDIIENYHLLKWLKTPVIEDDDFRFYHMVVYTKWIIALSGAFVALLIHTVSIFVRKKSEV